MKPVGSPAARITWRQFFLLQLLGQAAVLVMTIDWGQWGQPVVDTSPRFVAMAIYITALTPIALYADKAVSHGAHPRSVYPLMILINAVVACLVSSFTIMLFHAMFSVPLPPGWQFFGRAIHTGLVGTLGLIVYMNLRTTQRMLEGLRSAQLRRVQLDQRLMQSRLATTEAQIDPQMLFSSLSQIRDSFIEAAPDAEQELNNLIQKLRIALARIATANTAEGR